jgi:5'-nucleotidase
MAFILLTNDDGVDAPGLPSFARELSRLGDVEVIVPDRERSWIGKAITRFDPVHVERVTVDGITMHTASGYPADCAQLGIHALFGRRPDIVVSGINLGYNHGSAYLQSSGTVGAILEAAISEVPGLAFSTGETDRDWGEWREWAESPDSADMWMRLAVIATGMTEEMLEHGPSGTVSVGLPGSATSETERRITRVARVGYDKLFSEVEPGVYHHTFGGIVTGEDDMTGTDIQAAMDGVVSITPVEGAGFSERSLAAAQGLV